MLIQFLHNQFKIFLLITFSLVMLACQAKTSNVQKPQTIHAAYILYGQNAELQAQPLVRVIVAGAQSQCPALQSGQNSLATSARANPDPINFPITVCEALYPQKQSYSVSDGSQTFSLPAVDTQKQLTDIVVFGDTGCKTKQCQDKKQWPFADLASAAAKVNQGQAPDLVLHMGDYNYSGTPGSVTIKKQSGAMQTVQVYDAGDNTTQGMCIIPAGYYGQNSEGSQFPDSWLHWQSNFFEPAKNLLSAAPWIFTRGNHELCSRAGPGWFYFLDPSSSLLGQYHQQLSCPAAENVQPLVFTPPYLVDLNGLDVVVLDSTNACDSGLLNVEEYTNQMNVIQGLLNGTQTKEAAWLQTHRPVWGVDELGAGTACGPDGSDQYCLVTQTLQQAIKNKPLPKNIQLVAAGHMHRFQSVAFAAGHAQQLVMGNGGVKLSKTLFDQTTAVTIAGQQANVLGLSEHGYMFFTKQKGDSWLAQMFGVEQKLLLTCLLHDDLQCKKQ